MSHAVPIIFLVLFASAICAGLIYWLFFSDFRKVKIVVFCLITAGLGSFALIRWGGFAPNSFAFNFVALNCLMALLVSGYFSWKLGQPKIVLIATYCVIGLGLGGLFGSLALLALIEGLAIGIEFQALFFSIAFVMALLCAFCIFQISKMIRDEMRK